MKVSNSNSWIMPAEWWRHTATQLHWPSNSETWPGPRLTKLEEVYCNIIEELHFYESIHLFVENLDVRNRVMQKLSGRAIDLDRVIIHQKKINNIWARNSGPFFVKDEQGNFVILHQNSFTGRGESNSMRYDHALPEYIAQKFGISSVDPGVSIGAGNVEVNGEGIVLALESKLMGQKRNDKHSKTKIETALQRFLGADQVVWLRAIEADDSNCHADSMTLTRWLNNHTVLTMVSEDPEDRYYEVSQENLSVLNSVSLSDGGKLDVVTLPLPKIEITEEKAVKNQKFGPANYAGFYIANGAVLVSVFNHHHDQKAMGLFKSYFPGRKIIPIDCSNLIWGGGTIHSITLPWYAPIK